MQMLDSSQPYLHPESPPFRPINSSRSCVKQRDVIVYHLATWHACDTLPLSFPTTRGNAPMSGATASKTKKMRYPSNLIHLTQMLPPTTAHRLTLAMRHRSLIIEKNNRQAPFVPVGTTALAKITFVKYPVQRPAKRNHSLAPVRGLPTSQRRR